MENFTGRKVAIDASMAMYQFLIAVRMGPGGGQGSVLMNEAGEVTSHIQGMFNRTIKMMTSGIRPVYVFDGKPPQLKSGELEKRLARRAKAEQDLAAAKEAGDAEDIDRFSRRLVKVTKQHNEDCKELLRLMGVPCVTAPCEAEAQCAELARKNKVYATATEDMDALTFKSPKLLRKLTYSQSGKEKQPILELDFEAVLTGLQLTYEQFVDLCILCGCDYCTTIKGIGPKTALKLIRTHKNIENIIKVLKREKKYVIPPDWFTSKIPRNQPAAAEEEEEKPTEVAAEESAEVKESEEVKNESEEKVVEDEEEANIEDDGDFNPDLLSAPVVDDGKNDDEEEDFSNVNEEEFEIIPPIFVQARKLFTQCEVANADDIDLKWTEPDEEALKAFLIERMNFNAERVISAIKKLKEAQQQKAQMRVDSFFKVIPSTNTAGVKRKAEDPKGKKPDPKKGGGPKRR